MNLIKAMSSHNKELAQAGCPLGSLCQELDDECVELTDSAHSCLKFLLEWSTEQFRLMGLRQPEDLGFELVARIQGIILLGNVLNDPRRLKEQLNAVTDWIAGLEPAAGNEERAAA